MATLVSSTPNDIGQNTTLNPVIEESATLHVQELASSKKEPPKRFLVKDKIEAVDELPWLDLVPIDATLLCSSSMEGEEERNKLRSAFSSSGCFQVINHGMEDSFMDKVREVGKKFFALPLEEKKKYARTADDPEGYGNEVVVSEQEIPDWCDYLYLNVIPEDQRRLQFWPKNPENLREVVEEYTSKLKSLHEVLLKGMAKSLDLEEDCFLNQFGERPTVIARFNYYPPCSRPDLVFGTKPHTDANLLTLLLVDKQVGGLQVLKDGQWFKVPIFPYSILVNAGDQMEIMSNGIFKSPTHRVVTHSGKDRNSLPYFFVPAADSEIGPAEKLINENRPRLYKTVKKYSDFFYQHYHDGKKPIDMLKL